MSHQKSSPFLRPSSSSSSSTSVSDSFETFHIGHKRSSPTRLNDVIRVEDDNDEDEDELEIEDDDEEVAIERSVVHRSVAVVDDDDDDDEEEDDAKQEEDAPLEDDPFADPSDDGVEEDDEVTSQVSNQRSTEGLYSLAFIQHTFVLSPDSTCILRFRQANGAASYFAQVFLVLDDHSQLSNTFSDAVYHQILQDVLTLCYKWTFDGVGMALVKALPQRLSDKVVTPDMEIEDLHKKYAFSSDRFEAYHVTTLRELFQKYVNEINMVRRNISLYDKRALNRGVLEINQTEPQFTGGQPVLQVLRRIEVIVLNYFTQMAQAFYTHNKLHCHKSWDFKSMHKSDDFPSELLHVRVLNGDLADPAEKMDKKAKLILWLLYRFQVEQFAYIGDTIYLPMMTPSGIHMRAWRRYKPIKEVMFEITRKDTHFEMWQILMSLGRPEEIVEKLMVQNDWQFPHLNKHRNVFAFKNGLYLSNVGEVLGTTDTGPDGLPRYHDQFYLYENLPPMDPSIAATKYFDFEFQPLTAEQQVPGGWFDIPTPAFQSILKQQFSREDEYEGISRMMYRMIGRLLHPAGKLDNWQVWPYIKGCAGTGKSTIITRVCKDFFAPEDVGILASTSEKMFGLSAFVDKYLVIAPEMGKNCDFPQTTLQSMISAEDVNCAQKFKTAEMRRFNVPGICAGNENMGGENYRDVAGSLARRWFWFQFGVRIPRKSLDMNLPTRLRAELPMILLKCNHAYLEFVNQFQQVDIFHESCCPAYFRTQRDKFSEDNNPLVKFLKSDWVVRAEPDEAYVPFSDFQRHFSLYCKNELKLEHGQHKIEVEALQTALGELHEQEGVEYEYTRDKIRREYPRNSDESISKIDFYILKLDINHAKRDEFASLGISPSRFNASSSSSSSSSAAAGSARM